MNTLDCIGGIIRWWCEVLAKAIIDIIDQIQQKED